MESNIVGWKRFQYLLRSKTCDRFSLWRFGTIEFIVLPSQEQPPKAAAPTPAAAPAPKAAAAPKADGRVSASPLAKKMAAEKGIDINVCVRSTLLFIF